MNTPGTNLTSLTPDSPLIYFLRTLFGTAAEFAVYIPDSGDAIVINKGQLVSMVERNCADAMIKRLPQLAERNIFQPLDVKKIDSPEDSIALYVKNTGSFIASLELALNPDAVQFPEWWNAPVPFAMSSRGVLKLNDKAVSMFGTGLEKLNAAELPDRDEFIVRLDGLNGTRFMTFKMLRPGIFSIDDCTEDLTDAQDITWWAAVGQTWIKEIEARGGTWQRLNNPPEDKDPKTFRACEWNGEIQGWLNIEMPRKKVRSDELGVRSSKKKIQKDEPISEHQEEIKEVKKEEDTPSEEPTVRKSDDIIGKIGPQTMALLAAGQTRDNLTF
ncbi:MAG: hypothetical protein IJT20_01820 [Synergistaceae bacterium]|nr:hypothetical protein [Synergistaceae bacterium]